MTRRQLQVGLASWTAVTVGLAIAAFGWTSLDERAPPSDEAGRWALAALDSARRGEPVPEPPASARSYRADGPVFVMAWVEGRPIARHVGAPDFVRAIRDAVQAFRTDSDLTRRPAWSRPPEAPDRVRFTVSPTLGRGPVWLGLPYVSALGLVPLREGLGAELDGERAYLTPNELRADRAYDRGVVTPIPDLSFGVDLQALADRLARELGGRMSDLTERGTVFRFRTETIAAHRYPRPFAVEEDELRRAARAGARFLLRHQRPTGRYTYLYDGARGADRSAYYNLPRHAGTTWFLALMAHLDGMEESREGARRALAWLERHRVRRCGSSDRWCVTASARADAGSAALAAVAAAELLASGDDPLARRMLRGLTAFLRSLQRPDGELMHEYDLSADRPIDVQHMYYSGEAALALFKAHEVAGDERNLEAGRRLMRHLTGAGWDFLGSRYYYGEEHWTCIAAGEARDRIAADEAATALDFCRRWAGFNRRIQYREGETRWNVAGGYGVGPVIVPRLTPVGSRTEAFISTYEASRRAGVTDPALRAQVERGLAMLMRWQWRPGPVHLLSEPGAARGAIPGSPVDLTVRNDFVQHAGSAMIRWADYLSREAASK